MATYKVSLSATLPCTASMTVMATDEEAAKEYAEEHFAEANWTGSDVGDTPSGCDVEIYRVEEQS